MAAKGGEKRRRTGNYSSGERDLLVELVGKYGMIIENKKTDAVTWKEKQAAWQQVANEYNALVSTARDYRQLKQAYENWKKKAKKASAEEKVERKKTGGGSFEPKIDSTAEKLLAMLGNRAKPLSNPFDCDAEYNNDADTCDVVGWGDDPEMMQDSSVSYGNLPEFSESTDTVTVLGIPDFSATSVELVIPSTSAAASARSVTVGLETSANKSCTSGSGRNLKQWAGRRRMRPKASEQRDTAASKISALADHKRAYYDEKLKMDREEHSLRMQVLELKRQLYAKKLSKFVEE